MWQSHLQDFRSSHNCCCFWFIFLRSASAVVSGNLLHSSECCPCWFLLCCAPGPWWMVRPLLNMHFFCTERVKSNLRSSHRASKLKNHALWCVRQVSRSPSRLLWEEVKDLLLPYRVVITSPQSGSTKFKALTSLGESLRLYTVRAYFFWNVWNP